MRRSPRLNPLRGASDEAIQLGKEVGAENKWACRFYEKNGGTLTKQIEVHRGEESNVYVFDTA